jgi:hypothetical protein
MSKLPPSLENASTVESFSLCLAEWDQLLTAPSPLSRLEFQLLSRLKSPIRLLRWAVVRVEKDCFWCEGAYLKET